MPRFEVTHEGANGLEVGAVVTSEQCPAWLIGKCRQLPDEEPKKLEVSTPHRGRPKKQEAP